MALIEDEPFVRVFLRKHFALFAVVTVRAGACVRNPGHLASWRRAFRHLARSKPAPDRERVAAAVARLKPRSQVGRLEAGDFIACGSLVGQLAAAYVLRDAEILGMSQDRLRQDPDRLARVTRSKAVINDFDSKLFVSQVVEPWLDFVRAWMLGDFVGLPAESHRPWVAGFRLMEISPDAQLVRKIIDLLILRTRVNGLDQIVMARESLGSTALVQAQYQLLRSAVISGLSAPWFLVLRSGWLLWGYLLLIPLLLLVVLLVRPDPTLRRLEISRTLIL